LVVLLLEKGLDKKKPINNEQTQQDWGFFLKIGIKIKIILGVKVGKSTSSL
jgi:hypothetical protein